MCLNSWVSRYHCLMKRSPWEQVWLLVVLSEVCFTHSLTLSPPLPPSLPPSLPFLPPSALSLSAGPLALAKESLLVDTEPFFVLNSDVICSYPFKQLLEYHKSHGKEGTIVVSGQYTQLSQNEVVSKWS